MINFTFPFFFPFLFIFLITQIILYAEDKNNNQEKISQKEYKTLLQDKKTQNQKQKETFNTQIQTSNNSSTYNKKINLPESSPIHEGDFKVNPFTHIKVYSMPKQMQEGEGGKEQLMQIQETNTKEEKQEKKTNDTLTHSKILRDGRAKIDYLQSLRYEVFSLRQQLNKELEIHIPYGSYVGDDVSAKRFNAVAQSYNDALRKSGFFGGLSFGVLDIYTSGYIQNNFITTRATPFVYGGSGGYQKFFNHYIGTRLYGGLITSLFTNLSNYDLASGHSTLIPNPYGSSGYLQNFYALGFMSADLLFEFPLDRAFRHFIGGFAGLNIGIMYYRPYATHPQKGNYYPVKYIWNYNLQVDYSFNLGASLTLYNIHRFELGLGIPFSYLMLPGFAESANVTETVPAQFWRSAVMLFNYRIVMRFKK